MPQAILPDARAISRSSPQPLSGKRAIATGGSLFSRSRVSWKKLSSLPVRISKIAVDAETQLAIFADSLSRKREDKSPREWEVKILRTRNGWPLIGADAVCMKTNGYPIVPEAAEPYIQLQQQIHEALRKEHPEWVKPNGDCPICEAYESRLAELLGLSLASEHRSAA
jgi:hypothetical protein